MANEQKKKICVSSLVLGIIGVVFSTLIPGVSFSTSIPGVVLGVVKRKKYNSSPGIALNIVALSIAAVNSALAVLMTIKMFKDGDYDETDLTKS